ncbi:two pore domain potassium channel family protein [Clostridiaceae bacterium UIB06]|uniref:Two pore domain potassium channel family protein n=1 Tax=Clostridium thailandense TaxID=2794346 RepID=A0A949TQT6_9CLOT|nr:potassium channel family protein [Clostridium thailandense]MBV7274862.1 two pore domain potassium channel family protein [Clostridium thailandense]MCH5137607.1 two pore domain potassium channel family protein [Clostridiaceae bacterium UIB06]
MKLVKYLYKMRKKNLLLILGGIYIFTLVTFGVIYWKVANESAGEFFIFQNDINMNTKVNIFKKNLKIKIYNKDFNNIISRLITFEEYKRPLVRLRSDKDKNMYFFAFDKPLGENWAEYYYLLFNGQGITHMKIENVEESNVNNMTSTYKLNVSLYKILDKNNNENYMIFRKEESRKLQKVRSITIWIKDYPIIYEELFKGKDHLYPTSFYFMKIMENSVSFLDDSPLVLKSVANGKFKYPFWNFLYFSAVTITTLGYGDILPNSTMVRVLVMFETIFGVVIIGMFASCLFWNNK